MSPVNRQKSVQQNMPNFNQDDNDYVPVNTNFEQEMNINEKVLERNVAAEGDKQNISGGTLRSTLVILGYCFIAIVCFLAVFGLFTAFSKGSKKPKKKRKSKKDSEYGSDTEKSTTMSMASHSKEERKRRKQKDKKDKHRKDKHRKEKKRSVEDDQSYFVPLPDDSSSKSEDQRKRKKEKTAKRKKHQDKHEHRRDKQEKDRDKQEKDRRKEEKRHQSESFLDEFTGTNESSSEYESRGASIRKGNRNKYYQAAGHEGSVSETDSEYTIGPDGSSISSKFGSSQSVTWESDSTVSTLVKPKPLERNQVVMCADQTVPIAKQLAGLDRDAVIYVYKSSVAKIDKNGVHMKPAELQKVLPVSNHPKPRRTGQHQHSVPEEVTSPMGSPFTSTVLFQSQVFQSLKTDGSRSSGQTSSSLIPEMEANTTKNVFEALMHQKRDPINALPSNVETMNKSLDDSFNDSSVIFDAKRVKPRAQQQPHRLQSDYATNRDTHRSPRLKSILRRSRGSYTCSSSLSSLSSSARGKRPQSLKRVSFSHKMEVRFIK